MSGLPARQARTKVIGFQALGVALIGAFVFIAFLRPSEPDDLSGIDAPEGDNTPVVVKPDPRGGDKKPGDGDENRPPRGGPGGEGRDGAGSGGPGGGSGSGTSIGGSTTFPGGVIAGDGDDDGGGGGGGGGEDPPGNQYGSLPDLLMEEVGSPALFRGIDP